MTRVQRTEKPQTRERERHTKPKRSRFANRLLQEWISLGLPKADFVIVAVSGGADSTALLIALNELGKSQKLNLQLIVAHMDHGLRGKAGKDDAAKARALADRLGLEFEFARKDVKRRAKTTGDNLEQAARKARYEFLENIAKTRGATLVLTGHTMNDQAETVLLRLLRGSGAEGLGGIDPVRPLVEGSETLLVRPLLSWAKRVNTEDYCCKNEVSFVMDAMNTDERFSRVRVRQQLLPLMETFNPRVVESLARTAELLRADAAALRTVAASMLIDACADVADEPERGASVAGSLDVNFIASAPPALRRRLLRSWLASCRGDLRRIELVHLAGIEKLLVGGRGGRLAQLPGGGFVERKGRFLRFHIK